MPHFCAAVGFQAHTFRRRVQPWRANRHAVSAVIGAIMMVAVTVVLAAVLYALVVNTAPPSRQPVSLVVTQGPTTTNSTNASRNDTYLEVIRKLGSDDLRWNDSSFGFLVQGANGTSLVAHTWAVTDLDQDGRAGAGDRIFVRGMDAPYHGARLKVYYQGAIACEVVLA